MTFPDLRNKALRSGTEVTWKQYRTRDARRADRTETEGRPRVGAFWALAPGSGAIWVKPDVPVDGEPRLIKIYRQLQSGIARAYAYDDDLTAGGAA